MKKKIWKKIKENWNRIEIKVKIEKENKSPDRKGEKMSKKERKIKVQREYEK